MKDACLRVISLRMEIETVEITPVAHGELVESYSRGHVLVN